MLLSSKSINQSENVKISNLVCENQYKCDFCKHEFSKVVKRKDKKQSDCVKCPKCNNYLKTWS